MKINGIDRARREALEAAGVDPHGPMSQYKSVLDIDYVYCNQHHNVHRTDASCTVDAFEKFPLLGVTGDFDAALTAAREAGFRIHGEPTECQHCGQPIHQPGHWWTTVDGNDTTCPDRTPTAYGSGHEPVENLPSERIATL